jgi:hypothetical protein
MLLKLFQGRSLLNRTVFSFREHVSCPRTVTSLSFQNGTIKLIYSYSDDEPPSPYREGSLAYHGPAQRGTHSLYLIERSKSEDAPTEDTVTWDLRNPEVSSLIVCLIVYGYEALQYVSILS